MIRLALSVGRTDWQNLAKEHTPYELSVLQAYERIEPFGERRADMRMATQTLVMVQSNLSRPMSEDESRELIDALMGYAEREEPKKISPNQAVQMLNKGTP